MGSIFSGINNPGVDIEELTSTELATVQEIDGVSHAIGTILVSTGSVWSSLGVGTDTHVLTADSGEATGIKWTVAAGGGDVSKVGTPVDSQIGVWTGDGTIEGDSALTFDTSSDTLAIAASGDFNFGAVTILSDNAGTTTLQNIDALDATTEGIIETAIDTLANLTSIQGHIVTLTGDFIRSGAHSLTLTTTGATNVTLPTTGTLLANLSEDVSPQLGANLDAQSTYKIINLIDPTAAQDVATKNYVDLAVGFQFDYFFNNTISVGSYYGMTDTDMGGAESTDLETSISAGTDDQALVEFISPSGQPGIEELSAGVYEIHFHAERTSGNSTVDAIYVELYKYETNTTETLLGTSELTGEIIQSKEAYGIHITIGSEITIDSTDRLLIKFLANTGSGGGTGSDVEIYVEGATGSRFSFQTSSEILSGLFLRQDGTKPLSANWDVGAFTITGTQFISDIAGGTPPFVVTSTTEVANLKAATVATITGLAPDTATTQATQASITTCANLVTVGALTSGSIASGFGTISTGNTITTTADLTGLTVNATGDTSAADNAAIGYTAGEGLILTGQGTTNDITFKNDADATVFRIPTGTTNIHFGVDNTATNLILSEKTSIQLDPAGGTDGDYSGITVTGTLGATIAFGEVIVLDVTASKWLKADANAAAAADGDARGLIGICVVGGNDTNTGTILLNGIIRADAAFPALTITAPVYLSEVAGDIVVAKPTTTDNVIRTLGYALTANEIYFNPSSDYITHT